MNVWQKVKYPLLLFLVVAVAAFLRCHRLAERGIFMSDEGFYLNGAKTLYAALEYGWRRMWSDQGLPSFQNYLVTHGGGYPDNGKPGYFLLVTLAFCLLGKHDYAALFLSASLGILTVFLLYLIGKKRWHARVGLWGALILAVSPYHINYSRSALSVSSAIFFALCGLFFYLRWEEKHRIGKGFWDLLLSGGSFGFAYTCHYNLFWLLFFSVALHGYLCLFRYGKKFSFAVQRVALFVLAIALPILFMDLSYRIAGEMLEGSRSVSTGEPYRIKSYLTQIRDQFQDAGGIHFTAGDSFFYLRLFILSEGIAVTFLSLLGMVVLMTDLRSGRGSSADYLVLGITLLPIAFFNFYVFRVARSVLLVIPALALLSAVAMERLIGWIRAFQFFRRGVLVFFSLAILFSGIDRSADVVYARANTEGAYALIKSQKGAKCISSQPPNATFYLGKDSVYPLWGLTWEEAEKLYREKNYRYLLLDSGKFFSSRNDYFFISKVMHLNHRPIFTVSFTPFRLLILDYIFTGEKLSKDPTVQLYDLREIFEG